MQRYFIDEVLQINETYTDLNIDTHHIFNVMRMSVGDKIEIVDKEKYVFIALIENKAPFTLKIIEQLKTSQSNVEVTVFTPFLKGDKLDFMLQKCTELGASRFIFYNGQRSIVKLDDKKKEKRKTRYEKIVKEASEQSKRIEIPPIIFENNLKQIDFKLYDAVYIAYENLSGNVSKKFIDQLHIDNQKIAIIFGPEGGLTEDEVNSHKEFTTVQLGSRILRAETAPLYMLSIIDSFYN